MREKQYIYNLVKQNNGSGIELAIFFHTQKIKSF